ncbi:MAG: rhomboid family intramembrane serine protease [Gemmatimonadetes bacterium]|nr:rhomboid family intramembrane serine protease [Gemmatimonadota bacterium]
MAYRQFSFGYGLTPWVKRLLIANAAVFLLTWVLPALGGWLAFAPSLVLLRPWTLLTYMFVHAGFWHLFFNLLGLFFFGPPLEERWGSNEFLKYYLVCGLGGALFAFPFGFHGAVVGASAAIFGIMLAFAMNWPDAPIYIWGIFPVKAKWLVGILAALALMSAVGGSRDGIAHFAHLGGFAAGFVYLKLDLADRVQLAGLRKLFTRPRLKVVQGEARPAETRRARRAEEKLLDEVDRVLDKISTQGLASLSPEERKLLDEVSRRYRQN